MVHSCLGLAIVCDYSVCIFAVPCRLIAAPWSSAHAVTLGSTMCLAVCLHVLQDGSTLVLSTYNICHHNAPHNVLACAAVSGLTCCAFVSVQMHCPSTTRSIWSTMATSRPLAWRECGGWRRRENQARSQLASGQCTQRRSKSLKASAGLLAELRLAKMDSSQAGICMSCEPRSQSVYHQ